MSRHIGLLVTLVAVVALVLVQPVLAQRFHPSDPLLEDNDRLIDVTQEPGEIELSDMFDRFGHIFHIFGEPPFPAFVEAQNVNSVDEVPDSSWFTNRHAAGRLSMAEVVTASNVDGPPNPDETWTIFAGTDLGAAGDVAHRKIHAVAVVARKSDRLAIHYFHEPRVAALVRDRRRSGLVDGG